MPPTGHLRNTLSKQMRLGPEFKRKIGALDRNVGTPEPTRAVYDSGQGQGERTDLRKTPHIWSPGLGVETAFRGVLVTGEGLTLRKSSPREQRGPPTHFTERGGSHGLSITEQEKTRKTPEPSTFYSPRAQAFRALKVSRSILSEFYQSCD